jgi:hypothetical protein
MERVMLVLVAEIEEATMLKKAGLQLVCPACRGSWGTALAYAATANITSAMKRDFMTGEAVNFREGTWKKRR